MGPIYQLILQKEFLDKFKGRLEPVASKKKVYWSVRKHQASMVSSLQKTSSRMGGMGDCHGLRRVFPYSDVRLLEFCLAAKNSVKEHDGYSRYLIRGAMEGLLPEKIRNRRSKAPFAPEKRMLFAQQLGIAHQEFNSISCSSPICEIVDIKKLIELTEASMLANDAAAYLNEICLGIYLIAFLKQFDEFSSA